MGSSVSNPSIEEYASSPEKIWESKADAEEFMKNVNIPVLLMYGTEDIVFLDHFDSSIKAFMTIKGSKCIFLNGERHLLEIDCPERIVSEVLFFIDESEKDY